MSGVDFLITHVFDVEGRGGLLVAGRLLAGSVTSGMRLWDLEGGKSVRVVGVEFHGGAQPDRITLLVDRRDAVHVEVGHRLTEGM